MRAPLSPPRRRPVAIPARDTGTSRRWAAVAWPTATDTTPSIDPTETSIPPVRITRVMPRATMAVVALSSRTLVRFSREKNRPVATCRETPRARRRETGTRAPSRRRAGIGGALSRGRPEHGLARGLLPVQERHEASLVHDQH